MVSIKDIARHAGVSVKTVSRVVNNEANVREDTRKKVRASIEALDYVPNRAARLMRSSRSNVIGIMTDIVARTPNSVELIGGMQDRLAEANQSVLIANTGGTEAGEKNVWRTFKEFQIDGVIYATMYHQHIALAEYPTPMPTVLANCSAPSQPDLASVVPDDYQGGYLAAKYAIDKGYKRIAYLTLNPQIVASKMRIAAFRQALEEADLNIEEDFIVSGYSGDVGEEVMCGYDVVRTQYLNSETQRPDIILCGNDELALQAISAIKDAGLRVPEVIAVVGFDDFEMISTRVVPNLTTIGLPYYDMGRRAADKLLRLLEKEDLAILADKLPCPIVVRDSA